MNFLLSTKEKPLHLILFPLLFVLKHFYAIVTPANFDLIDSVWAWAFNFIIAVVICTGLTYAFYKILSLKLSKAKSAILSTIIFSIFFFLQDLLLATGQLFVHIKIRWVILLVFFSVFMACYWIIRSGRQFRSLTQYFNLLSFFLVVYTVFVWVTSVERIQPKVLNYEAPVYNLSCNVCPDVYLFILDSYTSNKSLRDYFGYDNKNFVQQLRELDFNVTDQSFSGYNKTAYSLSATLNLDRIENLTAYTHIGKTIQYNSVINSFKKIGYQIHNYSFFDVDTLPPNYSIEPQTPLGCIAGIAQSSILNVLVYDVLLKTNSYRVHTDVLKEIAGEALKPHAKPGFFYCHLLSPHPPFVMDAEGKEINLFNQSPDFNNARGYANQVAGINKLVLPVIAGILKTSPNAIIIVMGDHGYRYLQIPSSHEESYSVFAAYHGPRKEALDSLSRTNQIFELVFESFGVKKQK